MDADERRSWLNKISETTIGCAFTVSNVLGSGFLEKSYENALAYEIRRAGLKAFQQWPLQVRYRDIVVGEYCADILVENELLVELKVCRGFEDVHLAQCMNYLKATGLNLCLLINFGLPKIEIKRIVHNF